MHRAAIAGIFVGFMAVAGGYAQSGDPNTAACQVQTKEPNDVDLAIQNLQNKASSLKSYQARVDYTTKQPLLESQARRWGVLYYAKDETSSNLRIKFLTLQQDDEPEQNYIEQFLFNGVWLVLINDQTQRVERRQLAEPNAPIDAFSLASKHIPVLGFSKMEDLRKQFDVMIVHDANDPADLQHLHLTVRPDSMYKEDYTQIDFWVDRKIGLPAKITAVTTEEDIHEIRLLDPKVNEGIDPKMFEVEVPRGFTEEVIPLEREPQEP